jgi:hypothetical protein
MGKYILDFYCHEGKLVVEADGGQHSEPEQVARDLQRTVFLENLGIRVLRFWDNDVLKFTDAVREQIYRILTEDCEASPASPQPSPLPEGEGARGDFVARKEGEGTLAAREEGGGTLAAREEGGGTLAARDEGRGTLAAREGRGRTLAPREAARTPGRISHDTK